MKDCIITVFICWNLFFQKYKWHVSWCKYISYQLVFRYYYYHENDKNHKAWRSMKELSWVGLDGSSAAELKEIWWTLEEIVGHQWGVVALSKALWFPEAVSETQRSSVALVKQKMAWRCVIYWCHHDNFVEVGIFRSKKP